MTGKELIIYILENDLLDTPIFDNSKIVGLLSIDETAVRLGVGRATIITYIRMKRLDNIIIGNSTFVIDNHKLNTCKGAI